MVFVCAEAASGLSSSLTDQLSGVSSPSRPSVVTPTPIVLSAEALTNLLASHVMSSGPMTLTSNELIQYLTDHNTPGSAQLTLSLDSPATPITSNTTVEQVSNDLNVGAQEMVLEDDDKQQQHPLHL